MTPKNTEEQRPLVHTTEAFLLVPNPSLSFTYFTITCPPPISGSQPLDALYNLKGSKGIGEEKVDKRKQKERKCKLKHIPEILTRLFWSEGEQ